MFRASSDWLIWSAPSPRRTTNDHPHPDRRPLRQRLIALAGSGELFELGQGKQEWQPMAGIEGERIVSIAVRHTGQLVAILADGRLYEQYRAGATMGDFSQGWRSLPLPEI